MAWGNWKVKEKEMEQKQFHIHCTSDHIGSYVFLPGDPGRVEKIAAYLDDPVFVAQNREFTTYTGKLDGVPVSVMSTGIGGPSAAIAMEELVALGAHTFIRIGTCGGMQPSLLPGTLIFPTGAVRMEGTTQEYMPLAYPAVPDFALLSCLVQAAKDFDYPYAAGVVQSKDSFYGQHSPERMPVRQKLLADWNAWKEAGVLASEMECAALFVIAAIRQVRCAAVLQALWNQERENVKKSVPADNMADAIQTAVQAMRAVIAADEKART